MARTHSSSVGLIAALFASRDVPIPLGPPSRRGLMRLNHKHSLTGGAADPLALNIADFIEPVQRRYFVSLGQCGIIKHGINEELDRALVGHDSLTDMNQLRRA